jgi:hypothetical protein
MRENRTYGSEVGETGKPVFPTPIEDRLPSSGAMLSQRRGAENAELRRVGLS